MFSNLLFKGLAIAGHKIKFSLNITLGTYLVQLKEFSMYRAQTLPSLTRQTIDFYLSFARWINCSSVKNHTKFLHNSP